MKTLEALKLAEEVFLKYAKLHQAKNTPEGKLKASDNLKLAKSMREAIDNIKQERREIIRSFLEKQLEGFDE